MRAIVNQDFIIPLNADSKDDITFTIEGDQVRLRYKGENHRGRLVHAYPEARRYEIEIAKRIYSVQLESDLEESIRAIRMMQKPKNLVREVKSPMPGLVLKVMKAAGDQVLQGETLLILEAMKMENVIKSPADGTLRSIDVKAGDAVEKGRTLITFDI